MKSVLKNTGKFILYFLVWIKLNVTPRQFLIFASVLVGIFAGLAVVALKGFAHWVFLLSQYIDKGLKLPFSNSLLPVIGIFLTVFVVHRFFGDHIEKGLSQIMFAVARRKSLLPKKQMYVQILTNSLTVGFGGSAGVESPVAITGAAFGSNFAQYFKLSYKERTLLLACGVAAATAAAFNAPIAGVLFAIEVILADMSITAFIPIMISAATGAIVSTAFLSKDVLLHFSEKHSFEFHDILFYVFLGLITGWFSVYYSRNFQRIIEHFTRIRGVYKKAFYGASLLAVLIFVVPSLFGQGYESIKILSGENPAELLNETLFSGFKDHTWALLVFVGLSAFLKVFAVGFTLNSGGNGGNFAPSLFAGSYLGFLFASLINLLDFVRVPVASFTLVGMAGVFSSLFHAPLTAIFLIGEITGGYSLMVPLLVVSSVSFAVSKQYETYSMDLKKLAKKGEVFTSNKDRNILSAISLDEVLITDYKTLKPEDGLDKVVELISKYNQNEFPVLDSENKLVGLIELNNIRELIFNNFKVKYTKVEEVMQKPETVIYFENTLYIMLEKLEHSQKETLPILKEGKYYGFVSKITLLKKYRERLKSMRVE